MGNDLIRPNHLLKLGDSLETPSYYMPHHLVI